MKKSRLLEIIREEITEALTEAGLYTLKNPSDASKGLAQTIDPDDATEKSQAFLSKYKKISENQNSILVPSNLIRSYITELIYSAEDMEYTPEMVKELKTLKGMLPSGKISVEDALDIIQQTINITGDDIDAVEALGQAVDYDDAIVNAARDIKGLNEDQLDEMAKLISKDGEEVTFGKNTVKLTPLGKKTAEFIQKNPELEKSKLLNALKNDKEINQLLDKESGEEFAQNQTNKFAALIRGEREKGKQGRPVDPNKPKTEPKEPGIRGRKPMDSKSKSSKKDMDDEDKEAVKSMGKDETAKALASTPEEKKEKFNLGLKFIKKYKDDKPKVDAYLKKAKEEYKLSKAMIDDLKRAAGREVEA